MTATALDARERLKMGELWIDKLTFAEAVDAVDALVEAGRGGRVYTPNVDHVVLAEGHMPFREAYASAELSLVDGMPLVWASKLLGLPLPEKISGSDLIYPVLERAGQRRWKTFLLGGGPGVAEKAAQAMKDRYQVQVVGSAAPRVSGEGVAQEEAALLEKIRASGAQLLLVALGAPKQELWMHRTHGQWGGAVALGIGAALDFVAGTMPRAPRWMSRSGLEWLYRLSREPRRMWKRYLVQDPKFLLILARALRSPKTDRVVRRAS